MQDDLPSLPPAVEQPAVAQPAVAQPAVAQPSPQRFRGFSDRVLGHYTHRSDFPPPPASAPWRKHGGVRIIDEQRSISVHTTLVTRAGNTRFYILAFTAKKTGRGGGGRHVLKTFAATRKTEAQREQEAMAWLENHVWQGECHGSDDSTCGQIRR